MMVEGGGPFFAPVLDNSGPEVQRIHWLGAFKKES